MTELNHAAVHSFFGCKQRIPRGHPDNVTDIAHVIELALAPVFLLIGIAALLGVMTNRLARIIDRGRYFEQSWESLDAVAREAGRSELRFLEKRRKLASRASLSEWLGHTLVAVRSAKEAGHLIQDHANVNAQENKPGQHSEPVEQTQVPDVLRPEHLLYCRAERNCTQSHIHEHEGEQKGGRLSLHMRVVHRFHQREGCNEHHREGEHRREALRQRSPVRV